MDLGDGVFVTSLSTDQWEPDPDVGGPIDYTMPERESFLVLEGQARIEIADGPTLELKAGDIASIPMGAKTTWHITAPYREFWVFGSVADENKQL
jgi:uncharacterized cupin superfamily protein